MTAGPGADDVARAHAHGMLKVPQECLVRSFRQAQKSTEKDVSGAVTLVAELCKVVAKQEEVNWEKVVANLDRVEDRLRKVKKRFARAKSESRALIRRGEKRLRFHEEASEQELLDLLVADHLVRRGHTRIGQRAASEAGFEDLVDDNIFKEATEIATQLRLHRNIEPALAWCQENKSKLRRLDSSLEFALRKFHFLELAQAGRNLDAVEYARKYLAAFAADHLEEIRAAVSALVFPLAPEKRSAQAQVKTRTCDGDIEGANKSAKKRKTGEEPRSGRPSDPGPKLQASIGQTALTKPRAVFTYPALTAVDWEDLACLFERDSNRALSLEQQTTMQVTVKAGLASMRTAFCSHRFSRRFLQHSRQARAEAKLKARADTARRRPKSGETSSGARGGSSAGGGRAEDAEAPEDDLMETDQQHDIENQTSRARTLAAETSGGDGASDRGSNSENGNGDDDDEDSSDKAAVRLDPSVLGTAAKRALDCPCCDAILGKVARQLPLKQQVHSSLVCRLSGVVMTQDNPPMALPNGQVFSRDALRSLMDSSSNKTIECPFTGKIFGWDELKRVYLA